MTFNHFSGIKTKGETEWEITSPSEAIDQLSQKFGDLTIEQTETFRDLHSWLLENASKDDYVDVTTRYSKIIKLAKAELPDEIKQGICYYLH